MLHMSFPLYEIEVVGSQFFFYGYESKRTTEMQKLIKVSRDAGVEGS
jgi:hypothetical protein